MPQVQNITYDDKVVAGSPGAIEGVNDTLTAENANEIKNVINNNAEVAQQAFDAVASMYAKDYPIVAVVNMSQAAVIRIAAQAGQTFQNALSWSYKVADNPYNPPEQVVSVSVGGGASQKITDDKDVRSYTHTIAFPTTPTSIVYKFDTVRTEFGKREPFSSNKTVTFVAPTHAGVVSTVSPAANVVEALTEYLQTGRSSTKSGINLNNQMYCYAYPKAYGALTSIKDGNNFEYINSFTRTEITCHGQAYYCYVLTTATTASGVKYTFA